MRAQDFLTDGVSQKLFITTRGGLGPRSTTPSRHFQCLGSEGPRVEDHPRVYRYTLGHIQVPKEDGRWRGRSQGTSLLFATRPDPDPVRGVRAHLSRLPKIKVSTFVVSIVFLLPFTSVVECTLWGVGRRGEGKITGVGEEFQNQCAGEKISRKGSGTCRERRFGRHQEWLTLKDEHGGDLHVVQNIHYKGDSE